eukprot:s4346_g8.t1
MAFYVKPSSRYSPARFLSTTFQDRGPQLRKQRHSFGVYPKKTQGFAPQKISPRSKFDGAFDRLVPNLLAWPLATSQVVRLLRGDDQHVVDPPEDRRTLSLVGQRMCQQAFRKLLALGSARFGRLWACVQKGTPVPMDGRFLKKKDSHRSFAQTAHRQAIIEFLEEIYISLSEPMPEAKGPLRGNKRLAFQRRRGRRPRLAAQLNRKGDTSQMRLLPPGTFSDYLMMLRARPGCEKVSLKLFNKVWAESFGNKLGIRERTSHAVCEICCRHKYILKALTDDRLALQAQMAEYSRHLKRQYNDRCLYWASRAASRLNSLTSDSTQQLTVICDGMDHSKFRYPRSLCMTSKQFDPFLRPHLNMYACLAHGHMALLSLSEMTVAKEASFCLDVIAYCLHCIASRIDLRVTRLSLQSDNTCRELKNNSCIRLLSVWVATRRLFCAQLSCLQKGHSHEDVDAFFANVAVTVEKYNELHRPLDFRRILQEYLDVCARKHEDMKEVVMIDEVRDWWPNSKSCRDHS